MGILNQRTLSANIGTIAAIASKSYQTTPPPLELAGATRLFDFDSVPPATSSLIHPWVWRDANGNIIVSFRGTADGVDVSTDLRLLNNQSVPALEDARAFLQQVLIRFPDDNIIATGHSLGGAKALYSVVQLVDANPDVATRVSAIAFNPAALQSSMVPGDATYYPALTFVSQGDPAANVTQHMNFVVPGSQVTVPAGPTALEALNIK